MKAATPITKPSSGADSGLAKLGIVRLGSGAVATALRRADSALKMGNAQEAVRTIQPVLDQDPTHVGALEILAKAQWSLNQHELVLATLSRLLQINPYEPGYHVLRGNSLRNLGRYGDAVRSFVRAGADQGAQEAVAELAALQSDLVLHLLKHDPVFRSQYARDPESACSARGFEFGSETKIRHWVLDNEYSSARLLQRPS